MKHTLIILITIFTIYYPNKVFPDNIINTYVLAPKSQFHNLLKRDLQEFRISISDKNNPAFYCRGSLINGVLNLYMRTVDRETGKRSEALRGKVQLKEILEYFGNEIKAVKGRWEYEDNIDKVNELVFKEHMKPEEAIFHTWLAKALNEHGYIFVDPDKIVFEKEKGEYVYVSPHFLKTPDEEGKFITLEKITAQSA